MLKNKELYPERSDGTKTLAAPALPERAGAHQGAALAGSCRAPGSQPPGGAEQGAGGRLHMRVLLCCAGARGWTGTGPAAGSLHPRQWAHRGMQPGPVAGAGDLSCAVKAAGASARPCRHSSASPVLRRLPGVLADLGKLNHTERLRHAVPRPGLPQLQSVVRGSLLQGCWSHLGEQPSPSRAASLQRVRHRELSWQLAEHQLSQENVTQGNQQRREANISSRA